MGRRRWCSGSFRSRFSGWTFARKDSYPAANDGEILAAGLVVVQFGKEASQNARLLRPKVRDASRGSPRSPSASLRAGFRRAKNACSRMTIKLHHHLTASARTQFADDIVDERLGIPKEH